MGWTAIFRTRRLEAHFNVFNRIPLDSTKKLWDKGLVLREFAQWANWELKLGFEKWEINMYMDANIEDPLHNQCLCASPFCYNVSRPKGQDIGVAYGDADAWFKRCYTCGQRTHFGIREE